MSPAGIEPASTVSKTVTLSIKLRGRVWDRCGGVPPSTGSKPVTLSVELRGHAK